MKKIVKGEALLIICTLCYLTWWVIVFYPGASGSIIGGLFLFAAFIAGLIGTVLLIHTVRNRHHLVKTERKSVSGLVILVIGVVVYVVLLMVSTHLLHRILTTELFLIVGWATLQLSVVSFAYSIGTFGKKGARLTAGLIVLSSALCLYCYFIYYDLDDLVGYIDGMIPLVTVAAVSCVVMSLTMFAEIGEGGETTKIQGTGPDNDGGISMGDDHCQNPPDGLE